MKNIQLVQLTPEELVELINNGVKQELEALKIEILQKQDNEELLTREDACALLNINYSTLHRWTQRGDIQCHGISGRRYYRRSEIMKALKQSKK